LIQLITIYILLRRLCKDFGFTSTMTTWLASYLDGRQPSVRCDKFLSVRRDVVYGVPQGSVLGLLLSLLYTAGRQDIISARGLRGHFLLMTHKFIPAALDVK